MNKKVFLAIIITFLLLAGCGKNFSINTAQQNDQCTITTSYTSDYSQYVNKVWVVKDGTDNSSYNFPSFRISEIVNGKMTGKISQTSLTVPNDYHNFPDRYGVLTGTIDNGTAECQFSDEKGNKGNIKLVFKSNDEMEGTIKYTEKSQDNKYYKDGTFQFRPYNFNDTNKGISIIKDQSFTVDLNSWGNVRFITGKFMGGNDKHPTNFYLTDEDENILYDFDQYIYNIDVNAVSFQDVNKDGLKDIIIIIGESYVVPYGSGKPLGAEVFFQKTDGSFDREVKVNKELNDSENYKDVKTVTDYLSKKF